MLNAGNQLQNEIPSDLVICAALFCVCMRSCEVFVDSRKYRPVLDITVHVRLYGPHPFLQRIPWVQKVFKLHGPAGVPAYGQKTSG